MKESDLEKTLAAFFYINRDFLDDLLPKGITFTRATTFEEEGILTRNRGIVARFEDDDHSYDFQITVVKM